MLVVVRREAVLAVRRVEGWFFVIDRIVEFFWNEKNTTLRNLL